MNRHLIIFVKNPELGKVKTRIAATAGDAQALTIYQHLLGISQSNIHKLDCKVHIYYSSFIDDQDLFNGANMNKNIQVAGDLGEKMKSAFRDIFDQISGTVARAKVVIMGSDCPDLTSKMIGQAFDNLEKHNVVIGPTFDGGYYCIGMDDFYPELFTDVIWSTADVYSKTIQNTEKQKLTYIKLPTLHDIDHEEDWIAYQRRINSI